MRLTRLGLLSLALLVAHPALALWGTPSFGTPCTSSDLRSASGGISCTAPTGSIGDVLIWFGVAKDPGSAVTLNPPPGQGYSSLATSPRTLHVFCKITTATSESTTKFDSGTTSAWGAAVFARIAGGTCDVAGSPATNLRTSSAVDIATPALTVSSDNRLVLQVGYLNWSDSNDTVNSLPGGGTVGASYTATAFSQYLKLVAGYVIQTTATNVSAGTIDLADATSTASQSILVALDPAPTGGVTPISGPTGRRGPIR